VKSLLCILLLYGAAGMATAADSSPMPSSSPAEVDKYGPYPKDYITIVKEWLGTQLLDASSAVIEFTSEPRPADLPLPDGTRVYGYLVEFKVNSRNRFGAYTGFQKHGALIRNGGVVRGTGFAY
jgi:hypothetical protein